jgi:hypothetical protein
MVAKASLGLYDFIKSFKGGFVLVLFCVAIIIWRTSGKVYRETDHQYNLAFWITIAAMFILCNLLTIVYFRSDFDLINGAVTGFSINGDKLTVITSPLRMTPIINRPPKELKLTIHRFARDKTIYPIRIFPFVKYLCWELRTDETTVYVITQFFTREAIEELEKFLYWKNEEPLIIY